MYDTVNVLFVDWINNTKLNIPLIHCRWADIDVPVVYDPRMCMEKDNRRLHNNTRTSVMKCIKGRS